MVLCFWCLVHTEWYKCRCCHGDSFEGRSSPVDLVDRTMSEILRCNMPSCWFTRVWDPRICLTHHWETVNLWLQDLNMHKHGSFLFTLSIWVFPLPCNTVLFNHFISYQHHTRLPSGHTCISSVNRSLTLHVSCKHILRSSRYNYVYGTNFSCGKLASYT